MGVKMKAVKRFPFNNRTLMPGDPFNAEDEHQAKLLVAIGHAKRDDDTDKRYRRRDMRAEH